MNGIWETHTRNKSLRNKPALFQELNVPDSFYLPMPEASVSPIGLNLFS